MPHYKPHKMLIIQKSDDEVITIGPTTNVTHAELHVNHPLDSVGLPRSLTHLTFGKDFNCPIDSALNDLVNLTFLKFSTQFDQPIQRLPPRLIHLCFGPFFNKPLPSLPLSLQCLMFGSSFNQRIPELPLLDKLSHLVFDHDFNQLIDLPKNLISLSFGFCFNQPINFLPHKLRHLTLGLLFHQLLPPLPPNLEIFFVSYKYTHPFSIPPTITALRIQSSFPTTALPTGITSLSIIIGPTDGPIAALPNTITRLQLASIRNSNCPPLPPNLIYFSIRNIDIDVNQPLPSKLLYFKYYHRIPKIPEFPPLITHLSLFTPLSHKFSALPPCVTHLYLSLDSNFDTVIPFLQASITHLTLSGNVTENHLPTHNFPPFLICLTTPALRFQPTLPDTIVYYVTAGTAKLSTYPKSLKYILCKSFEKVVEPPPTVRIITSERELFPAPKFSEWKFPTV